MWFFELRKNVERDRRSTYFSVHKQQRAYWCVKIWVHVTSGGFRNLIRWFSPVSDTSVSVYLVRGDELFAHVRNACNSGISQTRQCTCMQWRRNGFVSGGGKSESAVPRTYLSYVLYSKSEQIESADAAVWQGALLDFQKNSLTF